AFVLVSGQRQPIKGLVLLLFCFRSAVGLLVAFAFDVFILCFCRYDFLKAFPASSPAAALLRFWFIFRLVRLEFWACFLGLVHSSAAL
ncbi:hypothetical protein A2U01_0014006, partial [Trifolium medium]|nr:hypothetical protein [Trifolium medium]